MHADTSASRRTIRIKTHKLFIITSLCATLAVSSIPSGNCVVFRYNLKLTLLHINLKCLAFCWVTASERALRKPICTSRAISLAVTVIHALIAGTTTAITRAKIVNTTNISIRVNPADTLSSEATDLLPTANFCIFTFAAKLAISPIGEEIKRAMLSWKTVYIIITPRIIRHI